MFMSYACTHMQTHACHTVPEDTRTSIRKHMHPQVPSKAEFQHAAMVFDHKFRESLKEGFEPREVTSDEYER